MRISVLGRFGISINGRSALPSGAKSVSLLALLSASPNSTISSGTLVRELWGGAPPRSYRTTLQTYVLYIRRSLGAAGGISQEVVANELLLTRNHGYELRVPSGALDSQEFENLIKRADETGRNKEFGAASEFYGMALRLWKGGPFGDVTMGESLSAEAHRLMELRLIAIQQKIETDIETGAHRQVLGDLARLTREYPYDEGLHGLLMKALDRSGRRVEALHVYTRLRSALVEEIGIEPGLEIRQLHGRILQGT